MPSIFFDLSKSVNLNHGIYRDYFIFFFNRKNAKLLIFISRSGAAFIHELSRQWADQPTG